MSSLIEAVKETPELLENKRLLKRTVLNDDDLTEDEAVSLLKAYDLDIVGSLQAAPTPLMKASMLNKLENTGMSEAEADWAYSFWEDALGQSGLLAAVPGHTLDSDDTTSEPADATDGPVSGQPMYMPDFEDTDDEGYYVNPRLPERGNGIYIPCGIGNTDRGFFIHGIRRAALCRNPHADVYALVYQYLTRSTVIGDEDIPAVLSANAGVYQLDYKSVFRLAIVLLQMVRHNCIHGGSITVSFTDQGILDKAVAVIDACAARFCRLMKVPTARLEVANVPKGIKVSLTKALPNGIYIENNTAARSPAREIWYGRKINYRLTQADRTWSKS